MLRETAPTGIDALVSRRLRREERGGRGDPADPDLRPTTGAALSVGGHPSRSRHRPRWVPWRPSGGYKCSDGTPARLRKGSLLAEATQEVQQVLRAAIVGVVSHIAVG
jgi:hypothetical protein